MLQLQYQCCATQHSTQPCLLFKGAGEIGVRSEFVQLHAHVSLELWRSATGQRCSCWQRATWTARKILSLLQIDVSHTTILASSTLRIQLIGMWAHKTCGSYRQNASLIRSPSIALVLRSHGYPGYMTRMYVAHYIARSCSAFLFVLILEECRDTCRD